MNINRRRATAALIGAGLLWGTTVPLSKVALEWLSPGWLTFARFGAAAAILLLASPRSRLRAAFRPVVLASGAFGYGGSVILQNAGISRTSVTHAALLIGAVPVLVAVIAALWQHSVARPVAWAGFAVSLAGVGLVTGGNGGGASLSGDGLVLASLLLSATFTVAQVRLLRGRDPIAVTAVQFLGAALAVLPFSAVADGLPAAPHAGAVLATVALAAGGTLLPFTLFAYGQSRVAAEIAGAFLNLEPLVGATAGVVLFGDPVGPVQAVGGLAILAGIAMSSLPLLGTTRPARWRLGYCRPGAGSDVERELGQAADAPAAAMAGSAPARRGLPAGNQARRRRVHPAARPGAGRPGVRGGRARRTAVERRGDPVPGRAGRRGHGHRGRARVPAP
jgi:drug/metabolite transporter (DMT)-like permease